MAEELHLRVIERGTERGRDLTVLSLQLDWCHLTPYIQEMIGSFKHRGLKRFFERDDPRRLPPDMVEKIRLILGELNTALNKGWPLM